MNLISMSIGYFLSVFSSGKLVPLLSTEPFLF